MAGTRFSEAGAVDIRAKVIPMEMRAARMATPNRRWGLRAARL